MPIAIQHALDHFYAHHEWPEHFPTTLVDALDETMISQLRDRHLGRFDPALFAAEVPTWCRMALEIAAATGLWPINWR